MAAHWRGSNPKPQSARHPSRCALAAASSTLLRQAIFVTLLGALASCFAVGVVPTTSPVEAAVVQPLTATWIDQSEGTASILIERRLSYDPAFVPIAYVPPGVTTYVDVAVSLGSTYCYRVQAVLQNLVSDYSNEACATAGGSGTLAVVKTGIGSGVVSSAPAGIACGSVCSAAFVAETVATLTATPDPGSRFVGWSGACSGDSLICAVTVTGAAVALAEFQEATGEGCGSSAPTILAGVAPRCNTMASTPPRSICPIGHTCP